MSKVNLDSIFNVGKESLTVSNRTGATIYKNELFEGLNPTEKKSLRIKLRRRKDAFISTYLQVKNNETKLNQLKKDWLDYSKLVYTDVTKIIDNNATSENIKYALEFINAMQEKEKATEKKAANKSK